MRVSHAHVYCYIKKRLRLVESVGPYETYTGRKEIGSKVEVWGTCICKRGESRGRGIRKKLKQRRRTRQYAMQVSKE